MLKTIRQRRLFFRLTLYSLAMVLLAILFAMYGSWVGKSSFWLPWLVCYIAGFTSMLVVEPFRHTRRSPYGFMLGTAVRAVPLLFLVIVLVVQQRPLDHFFAISLLLSYFLMLVFVTLLTIPSNQTTKSEDAESDLEKKEEKFSDA